jgi:hypothetical protein
LSQKATRLPSAKDRLIKNKAEIKELYALNRQRIATRTIQPPSQGTGSPRGTTAPAGNFLKTEGDTMIGPIAYNPVLVSIVDNPTFDDDDSINISRNSGTNPPDYSSYVLVTPVGVDDDLRVIFGAAFNGQILNLQGTASTTIRLQNGDASNGGNIKTPDDSEFAILGAKVVQMIFDPTISPSAGVNGAWRIMDSRGIAERDIIHAKLGADESLLVAGDRIGFDTIIDGVQTGIQINATAGIFENFQVGRTYVLEAAIQDNFAANTGTMIYQWFDITNAVFVGNTAGTIAITGSGSASRQDEQQTAVAVISPTVAGQQYEVRIIAEINLLDVLEGQSYVFIKEEGGAGFGGGGGGGGINFPILYPIDAIGTAPVDPTTTDIDLAATTAHVHTMDTVGDVLINFINPPAGTLNITGELIVTTDGSGSTIRFVQTTQPSSTFVIPANTRTIITFQSSDGGLTYDVFEAGQAGGGGGATALNDLSDVSLSGVTLNDVFQFNGTFWINKQSFNFGTSPFGSTGFLRYSNDEILLSARNAGDTGDLQLKANSAGTLDWTDSDNNVASIQTRTQHPSQPDNIVSLSVGSGTSAEALIDSTQPILNIGAGGGNRLQLDVTSINHLKLRTQAGGVTSQATFDVTSVHVSDPDNTLSLSVGTGSGGTGLIDNSQPILDIGAGGGNRLRLDTSVTNILTLRTQAGGVTSQATFNVTSVHVTDPDNILSLTVGVGSAGTGLIDNSQPILDIGAGGGNRLRLDTTSINSLTLRTQAGGVTSQAVFNVTSVHVSDPDNVLSLSIGTGSTGEGLIDVSQPILNFGAGGGNRLQLDTTTLNHLKLRTQAGGVTSQATFDITSVHVSDADNTLSMSIGAGSSGQALIDTTTSDLVFGAGGANRLFLETSFDTTLKLETPSGTSVPAIFRLHSHHVTDPRNDFFISQQSSATGKLVMLTTTEDMQFIVTTLGALSPHLTLNRTGSANATILRNNALNALDLIFEAIPPTAIAGRIADISFVSDNSVNSFISYARMRARTVNVVSGNEDGALDFQVAINGTPRTVLTLDGSTVAGEIGFFDVALQNSRQSIVGSRGGNAALASLITALSSYGLVADFTTA